jgi:hypothetical protein
MGASYQRQDTANNIANGNVINADDLDAEFNALETAFAASTGHSHDGTSGEGGPITVVGPSQEIIVSGTQVLPKTNNTIDLGSATFKFKDAYVDGVMYVDSINYNGTVLLPTAAELNFVDGVTSSIQTQLDGKQPLDTELTALAGLTSAADRLPYFTGSGTAALATFTAFGRSLVDDADATAGRATLGLGTIATQNANSVTITGGSLTGITDLTVADGGTGVSTLTGIVKGNGTSPFSAAVAGTDYLAPAAIGVTVQAFDAGLQSLAGLTTSADKMVYTTASDTYAVTDLSLFARTILDDTSASAVRTTIDAQQADATLTSLSGLSLASGDLLVATGVDTVSRLAIGTANQILRVNAGGTAAEWVSGGGAPDFVLEDQKTSGTNGQTIASANTWTTRDLNTEVRDIASIVSITSNEFTVTANCWVEWTVPGRDHFQSRLYNVTDANVTAVGEVTGNSALGARSHGGAACVAGKTYRIEHNANTAGQVTQNARGQAGTIEVYTRIRGWRT